MILSEIEKDKIRELHKNRSIIKEQPGTAHCQRCLQMNPTSAAQNCNCPTCPCHVDFDVQALECHECLALFWTHQQKEDNCNCNGCPCGAPITDPLLPYAGGRDATRWVPPLNYIPPYEPDEDNRA